MTLAEGAEQVAHGVSGHEVAALGGDGEAAGGELSGHVEFAEFLIGLGGELEGLGHLGGELGAADEGGGGFVGAARLHQGFGKGEVGHLVVGIGLGHVGELGDAAVEVGHVERYQSQPVRAKRREPPK